LYDVAYPNIESDDPDIIPGHTYEAEDLEGLERLLKKLDQIGTKSQAQLNKDEWTPWG